MSYKSKVLELAAGGTNSALTAANGGILYSSATAVAILAPTSTANQPLLSGASGAPGWSTATYPGSTTINRILYSSANNVIGQITTANNGTLVTDSSGVPSILAGPGTTGNVLQSNAAAAPSFSTATYPSSTTINQVLYSSANNVVAGITAANNGTMISGTTGVPSWLANGTTGQVLTATTGSPPSWASAAGTGAITTVTGQLFTASGAFTYTPTANMKYVIVELIGGGGGGGGANGNSLAGCGGGGGGGGYARFVLTAAQVGASLSGNVGALGAAGAAGNNAGSAGGNTTLATSSAWTVAGGAGGASVAGAGTVTTTGGAGGTVTTGTGTILATSTGGSGGMGSGFSAAGACGGAGGSNTIGCGGPASYVMGVQLSAGFAGIGYGAGGSGGSCLGAGDRAGGAGIAGAAIFTEFV